MSPLVTIIIPTYNRKELLEKAILSVVQQSQEIPFAWELIIIDDGSKDGTEEYVKHFTKEYPNISYAYQENAWVWKARNNGLSRMSDKSDYLVFLDSDDELMPELIRNCLEKWNTLKEIWKYGQVLGFYFLCEDENGNIIGERKILQGKPERSLNYDDYLSGVITIEMWLMTKSSLFQGKDALRFEEDITTEWVMWAKMWKYMGEKSLNIIILPSIWRLYRIEHTGEQKITRSVSTEKFRKNAIGNERVIDIIGDDLLKRKYTGYYQDILIQGALNWFLYDDKKRWNKFLSQAWKAKKNLKIWLIWILSLLPKRVLLFLYKKHNER